LGEWLLRGVFQLEERELLTSERLAELHINAIRFIKYVDTDEIGIEFIWIDEKNPPKDSIGWVAKNKISNRIAKLANQQMDKWTNQQINLHISFFF